MSDTLHHKVMAWVYNQPKPETPQQIAERLIREYIRGKGK